MVFDNLTSFLKQVGPHGVAVLKDVTLWQWDGRGQPDRPDLAAAKACAASVAKSSTHRTTTTTTIVIMAGFTAGAPRGSSRHAPYSGALALAFHAITFLVHGAEVERQHHLPES
jgi:hypothetical protein